MRGVVQRVVVASVVALAAACGRDTRIVAPEAMAPAAPSEPDITGRYSLALVNERGLPQVIGYDGVGAIDALSGVIELTPDKRFTSVLTLRRRGSGGIEIHTDTLAGTYLRVTRSVLLVPADQRDPTFFDVKDGRMTTFGPSATIVYLRR